MHMLKSYRQKRLNSETTLISILAVFMWVDQEFAEGHIYHNDNDPYDTFTNF